MLGLKGETKWIIDSSFNLFLEERESKHYLKCTLGTGLTKVGIKAFTLDWAVLLHDHVRLASFYRI